MFGFSKTATLFWLIICAVAGWFIAGFITKAKADTDFYSRDFAEAARCARDLMRPVYPGFAFQPHCTIGTGKDKFLDITFYRLPITIVPWPEDYDDTSWPVPGEGYKPILLLPAPAETNDD